ncbi:tol-pal system protein YbgF [Candidatus Methylobacter oryzae]|uniref:Cell division coordinator CpoB n=1 Tax=Candidatus Methylobacter oryzae TaxID=2497749 RepID=A0ABY3CAM7_9GAMM|nr:tol-pal system protein YbgF [Candidatus Methylobacter oryzae]TRW93326.1 tol-pal system protein YbgF [Candidatus Methylobacter oryzae]
MKARLLLLLWVCNAVQAEPLPPVIDNSMYPAGEVTTAKPSSTNALYEIMARLEQLQGEVQQLTGKVEEQANLIAEMKKSQGSMYSDFDERIRKLEKKSESAKPSATENVPAEETTVGVEAKATESQGAAPTATPEVKQAPVQKQEAAQASASPGDEKQQYQQAYDALRNGHTAQAIAEFNALLSKNSKGEYANNAQYWLGEAYRVNQDIDAARKAFNNVIQNYPGSAKVPDALLKLGIIEVEQKNPAKAREYLTRVTTDFPSSTAARLASKKLLLLDDVKQ